MLRVPWRSLARHVCQVSPSKQELRIWNLATGIVLHPNLNLIVYGEVHIFQAKTALTVEWLSKPGLSSRGWARKSFLFVFSSATLCSLSNVSIGSSSPPPLLFDVDCAPPRIPLGYNSCFVCVVLILGGQVVGVWISHS